MRLAVCHPFLYVKGGAERVVLKIAKHFDAKIYCALYEPEKTFPEFGDCDIEVLKTRFFRYLPGQLPIRVRHAVAAGRIFYHKVLPGDYDVINAQGTPSEWIRHYNSPVVWYCLHEKTPVLKRLPDGTCSYGAVSELKPGEMLPAFTDSGDVRYGKVLRVKARTAESLAIVRLKNGREMTVTPEHRFFVRGGGGWVTKKASELTKGDLIPVPRALPGNGAKKEIDVRALLEGSIGGSPYWRERMFVAFDGLRVAVGNRKTVTLPSRIRVTPEFMRFLGYYVAEGSIYFRHSESREDMRLLFTFGLHEKDSLVRDCVECSRKSFGIEPTVRRREKRKEYVLTYPNAVALLVRALGAGSRASEKRVPDLIFNVGKGLQKEFLNAYAAGDGHFYPESKRFRCITVSYPLANSLQYLLACVGKPGALLRRRAHKFDNYRERLDHQIYGVTYHADGSGYQRYGGLGKLLLVPVKEVLRLREGGKVVDVEMDGNHSFLAGDAIFTHNCHSPNREAFDLYEARMKGRRLHEKALYWGCLKAFRLLESRTVPKIEHIFANSANTQARIGRYLGRESEILRPGIDAGEYWCGGYENFFLYPSRITPEKRFEYAIDAFREFRKANPRFRDWKLVIAGSLFADRPEHAAYYEWVKNYLGSDGRIVVDADQERLSSLYARCFAVLYAPMNEDFGIVPLEALASFKPVISVNEGGPKEVVSDGENGFLVNSPAEMAEKMAFLAGRPELAEEMGKNGRRLVETRFAWKAFLERFEAACRKVKKLDAPPA